MLGLFKRIEIWGARQAIARAFVVKLSTLMLVAN
jgi:hypothetical protein